MRSLEKTFAMRKTTLVAAFVLAAAACSDGTTTAPPPSPPAPITLSGATPAAISARGGEVLTLTGSGFAADTAVKIGDVAASKIELVSATELRVTAPPLWAGVAAVEVSGPGGDAKLASALTVAALDLRFVQAPTYSLAMTADIDAGPDAAAPATPPPSPPLHASVTADFDGDGDVDLASCAAGQPCHLLVNDGKGNYDDTDGAGDPRFGAGSIDARLVANADLDGDGDVDLVLAPASGALVAEVNDGAGRFSEQRISWTQYGDGGAPELEADGGAVPVDPTTAIAIADLDGDGAADLVVGNAAAAGTPIRVLHNASTSGALRFTELPIGAIPAEKWAVSQIAAVDADGDGTVDLVLATPGAADGESLRLLLGRKSSYVEAHAALPSAPGTSVTALAAADVNADGAADLIVAGQGQDRLLLNDGSGHFFDASATAMPLDDTTATSLALVDLDRDRDLDLVIGNAGAATRLYLNDGKGAFRDYTPLLPVVASNAAWVSAADVDGDSDEDIFVVGATPVTPRLYLSVEKKP